MTEQQEQRKEVARIIAKQLSRGGGYGRLQCMIGASNFVVLENGLSFRFPRNGRDGYKVNYVKITLNGLDLYDVEFGRIHGLKYTVVTKHENAYNDSLEDLFYNATGLCLSF